ncbi:hypothetical protein [Stenotrophomonas sp.]|uniref:hypothetical protein n=1 Tax=Stenotrophomonas sp. TaxID=69392 RepID=UPI0028A7C8E1|nr:hypothetical protein [Stenotrophomonas sp.]
MQSHWADTPHIDYSNGSSPPAPWPQDEVGASSAPPCVVCDDEPVPYILLRGPWLRKMGFDIGAKVRVDASEGLVCIMMITPAPPVVSPPPTLLHREGVVDRWPLARSPLAHSPHRQEYTA